MNRNASILKPSPSPASPRWRRSPYYQVPPAPTAVRSRSRFPLAPRVSISAGRPMRARCTVDFTLRLASLAATATGSVWNLRPALWPATNKALGDAVRSVNRPQLNIVYLATHTSRDAETYGIEVPARMAAK